MPTSSWLPVTDTMSYMFRHFGKEKRETFVDIGAGYGRWGLIAREMGDIIKGRVKKSQWVLKTTAIDIYGYYKQNYECIYDDFVICDFRDFLAKCEKKSINHIMFGDVIEHVPKKDAMEILRLCFDNVVKNNIIINVPLGHRWKQGAVGGNPNEAHVSVWEYKDLECLVNIGEWIVTHKIYNDFKKREYLSFWSKRKGV